MWHRSIQGRSNTCGVQSDACSQSPHAQWPGGRTDQRHAPVAVLLHLEALPAALAVLHPAHTARLCSLPRWKRPQLRLLSRELDSQAPEVRATSALRHARQSLTVLQGSARTQLSHRSQGSSRPAPHCCWRAGGRRQARLWGRLQHRCLFTRQLVPPALPLVGWRARAGAPLGAPAAPCAAWPASP
jgi:hypothetical protein